MHPNPSIPPESNPDDLPRLTTGLRTLQSERAGVPRSADDAMHAAISAHFADFSLLSARRQRSQRTWMIAGGVSGLGIAAAIVLAAWPSLLYSPPSATTPNPQALAQRDPADLDANGRIDILDAFALARRIESRNAAAEAVDRDFVFDINADGTTDQRDVDAIAMRAVALTTPSSGGGAGGRSS